MNPAEEYLRNPENNEFKGCGNGYYYITINEACFIGVDID